MVFPIIFLFLAMMIAHQLYKTVVDIWHIITICICLIVKNKMKNNKYYIDGTIPKCNRKIVEKTG